MRRLIMLLLTLGLSLQALAEHPLSGKLWRLSEQRFVSEAELFAQLPTDGWLMLGEQHDNPHHHQLQQRWIEQLSQRGQLGAVALEMARTDQQPLLDQALGQGEGISPDALDWNPGWSWELYGDLVRSALDHAPRVIAADLNREQQRSAYHQAPPQDDKGEAHANYMRRLLFDSHCGQLPRDSLEGMRQVQLARDQHMAMRLEQANLEARSGIMLTGTIHARRDLGIPLWLDRPTVTVLLTSVQEGRHEPYDYLPESYPDAPAAADYLMFTEAIAERDYCAELRSSRNTTESSGS
jgi:uncharacterized iron-regulated protein